MHRHIIFAAAMFAAGAAHAAPYCPERPGQTTAPCILEPGRVAIETSAVEWTREREGSERVDTLALADSELRIGVAPRFEVQLGWTPYAEVRTLNRATGDVDRRRGVGDISIGAKYGLSGIDGPVALQAIVTLPTGAQGIGDGDWSAIARLPIEFDLGRLSLGLTPEIGAVANAEGRGRHLSVGAAAGVGIELTERLQLDADFTLFHDGDPAGRSTSATFGAALSLNLDDDTQVDIGGIFGLNRDTPDAQLALGLARRF